MLTSTIEYYLTKHCRGQFMEVFSSDTLPTRIPNRPAIIVCNTDPSDRSGEHWVCIYIDRNRQGDFFDSFGRRPCQPFCAFMDKHCIYWTYNDMTDNYKIYIVLCVVLTVCFLQFIKVMNTICVEL